LTAEFFRFVVVGVIGFIVDGGGTWLLVHLGVPPVAARVGPLLSAIVVTWLLNRRLTFKIERPKSRAELVRYATVALSSAAMNFALYSALVLLGVYPILAVAVATLVLLLYSFFAYRRMVFR
jgi:putative flippase GtrA